jgi:prophage regulatory protein
MNIHRASRRLIRLPEVLHKTGLRERTLYGLMTDGKFPKPTVINPSPDIDVSRAAKGWLEDEVDQWIEERLAARAPASADA